MRDPTTFFSYRLSQLLKFLRKLCICLCFFVILSGLCKCRLLPFLPPFRARLPQCLLTACGLKARSLSHTTSRFTSYPIWMLAGACWRVLLFTDVPCDTKACLECLLSHCFFPASGRNSTQVMFLIPPFCSSFDFQLNHALKVAQFNANKNNKQIFLFFCLCLHLPHLTQFWCCSNCHVDSTCVCRLAS